MTSSVIEPAEPEDTSAKVLLVSFFLVMATFFLTVNYLTPLIGEDFALSAVNVPHQTAPLKEKIGLITDRIVREFTQWNARFGEQLAIFFLGFNKVIFDLLNSLVAMGYFYIIALYAFGRPLTFMRRHEIYSFVISFALTIFFMPAFGEIFFWTTGACNYLWGSALILIFGLPYRMLLSGEDVLKGKPALFPGFCILGFISGMSSENASVAIGLFVVIIIFYSCVRKRELGLWVYCGIASLVGGVSYLLLSRSTKIRVDYFNKVYGVVHPTMSTYLLRARTIGLDFLTSNEYTIGLIAILLLMNICRHRKRMTLYLKGGLHGDDADIFSVFLFVLVSLTSTAILILPPYYEKRAFFWAVTMLTIVVVRLFGDLIEELSPFWKRAVYSLMVIICLMTAVKSFQIYEIYAGFNKEAAFRDAEIKTLSQRQAKAIKVKAYRPYSLRVLNTREDYIGGVGRYFYAMYYGLNDIINISP
jgi:hypothetical protein